jgi:orotidine-5'-phosphate decarboxylase
MTYRSPTHEQPFTEALKAVQIKHQSQLCVGLDPDPQRFPGEWKNDPSKMFDFCAAIIDATSHLVCAFKPQIAYFHALRAEQTLERLIAYIHTHAPDVPVVLDAKRGDIGSTAEQYAKEAFERYRADALTVSPFMGFDSLQPYQSFAHKGLFVLCRTSNAGGNDFQSLELGKEKLYERIARLASGSWNTNGQLGLVVGATYPQELARVREIAPQLPLLIPGIGAQGGDLQATSRAGKTKEGLGMLINSSRAILYAGSDADFASKAEAVAISTRDQINAAISSA